MAVDFGVSQKAPIFPVPIDEGLGYALDEYSRVYGNKAMTQSALKALQVLPLVYAGLSVKEHGQMSKTERERASSKCMQELAIPGFIKLVEAYEAQKERTLPMPHKWKDMVYHTTLGTGV